MRLRSLTWFAALRAISVPAGSVLVLSVTIACGGGTPVIRDERVNQDQRLLAADAVEHLRKALNEQTCEDILDAAAGQARSQEWRERCSHIRDAWGSWQTFQASYWYRSGDAVIAVEGIAEFAKGKCVVRSIWNLRRSPARMLAFSLRSDRDRVDFPSLPPPRYFDPPQNRSRNVWEPVTTERQSLRPRQSGLQAARDYLVIPETAAANLGSFRKLSNTGSRSMRS